MYSWLSFQKALPTLQMIESAWQEYLAAQSMHTLCEGILEEEAESSQQQSEEQLTRIQQLSEDLPGEVFFWHYPFYQGDFLELMEALSTSSKPVQRETTQLVRDRFRTFMKSIPETDKINMSVPGMIDNQARKRTSIKLLRKLAEARQTLSGLAREN